MLKKILFFMINLGIVLISDIVILTSNLQITSLTRFVFLAIPILIFLLSMLFKFFKFKVFYKVLYTLFIIGCLVIICYSLLSKYNYLEIFVSVSSLKNYILSTKEKGVLVYIIIQILQVVFLPIPASIICIVGSIIYGPIIGGLYCCIGVLVGSYISYFIGRIFGYKIVSWIVGKDNTNKYSDILLKRGSIFLGLAFLLPMFPDDILCFIAGTTRMKLKNFFFITLITRPIGVICMAIFGGGYIIPFSGWGIYVWAVILVVAIVLMYVIFKWQDNIQNYILSHIFKKKYKNSNN